MFPMAAVACILAATIAALELKGGYVSLRKGKFFRFLGIMLVLALNPLRGGIKEAWTTTAAPGTVDEPGTRPDASDEFFLIADNLRFSVCTAAELVKASD